MSADTPDVLAAKAAAWDRVLAMWNDPNTDWDYDSRDLMLSLTDDDGI